MIKDFLKLFILSLFFIVVIFFINYNFFSNFENEIIEEKFIEPKILEKKEVNIYNIKKQKVDRENNNIEHNKIDNDKNQEKIDLNKKYLDYFKNNKNEASYNIFYNPIEFKQKIKKFIFIFSDTIKFYSFYNKINFLQLEFFENKIDTRWRMVRKKIKLFWFTKKKKEEYLSVFIHEFWHYIDIYFLKKDIFWNDLSTKFYNISWLSTKTKKGDSRIWDFVSGYAMTNKYEDFAESFDYYVLHNKSFLEKTKKSKILEKKYNFFKKILFKENEFCNENFSIEKKKDYYRDITKIPYNLEKFLSYIK